MIGLNKIGLNQVQLNRLRLNAPFPTCRKMAGGGGSSDGFPQLPGDVTRWYFGGLTNEMMAAMDDPRIEDADHKGRFLSFKNFAWKEGSGISDIYPGALVFDGVDDYGVCENFPILTKEKGYTVVALRQWISKNESPCGLVSNVKSWLTDGAFVLEYFAPEDPFAISFGALRKQKDLPRVLTYQTSKSYNGTPIATGDFEGTDVLHVGKLAPINVGTCINAAIWELVFLDHDATEEELTKIKDYFVKTYPWLFPDQAWTVVGKTNEDEDRATISNITGNGVDLRLFNFGYTAGSGYENGTLVLDGVDDRVQTPNFTMGTEWTIVGNWELGTVTSNINAGLSKPRSFFIYNRVLGIYVYIRTGSYSSAIAGKTVKAFSSDGTIYLDDWSEINNGFPTPETGGSTPFVLGLIGTHYSPLNFRNLSIYNNQILSKDDCIKAYNYLQTLKAK